MSLYIIKHIPTSTYFGMNKRIHLDTKHSANIFVFKNKQNIQKVYNSLQYLKNKSDLYELSAQLMHQSLDNANTTIQSLSDIRNRDYIIHQLDIKYIQNIVDGRNVGIILINDIIIDKSNSKVEMNCEEFLNQTDSLSYVREKLEQDYLKFF